MPFPTPLPLSPRPVLDQPLYLPDLVIPEPQSCDLLFLKEHYVYELARFRYRDDSNPGDQRGVDASRV